MIALLQRVRTASVVIDDQQTASIKQGILVFVAVHKDDDEAVVARMCERVLGYRIFADDMDKMNKNVMDIKGEILAVPQFTLAAETNKGMRPNFSPAAAPELGKGLFDHFLSTLKSKYARVKAGEFGANMQVHLTNDGPVTFWLQI